MVATGQQISRYLARDSLLEDRKSVQRRYTVKAITSLQSKHRTAPSVVVWSHQQPAISTAISLPHCTECTVLPQQAFPTKNRDLLTRDEKGVWGTQCGPGTEPPVWGSGGEAAEPAD